MKCKKLLLGVCLVLCASGFELKAQETSCSGGGEAKSKEGSVSYTIGQIVYTTDKSIAGSVAKGVQQAYEITVVTGIEELIKIECSVYPNPTIDELTLRISDSNYENLNFNLFDSSGKLLTRKNIESTVTKIRMNDLSSGIYFLKLEQKQINSSKELRTFKIIKN